MIIEFIHPSRIFATLHKPEYGAGQHTNIFGVMMFIHIARPTYTNAVAPYRLPAIFNGNDVVNLLSGGTAIYTHPLIPFKYYPNHRRVKLAG